MSDRSLTQTEVSLNPLSSERVNITIDGVSLSVPKGENVIEAALNAGIDIPYFCYHPRLSKGDAANCRMCLVEVASTGPDGSVRKMPKPQTACTLPASEGMIIDTKTEKINRDRKGVLEFLLINHPLDCPVCDRGGECPLQNNTLYYGASASRFTEEKRHYPKAYPLSEQVVLDRERCIQCARCTRFTDDISGDAQLGLLKRGSDVEVGTFAHTSFNSKFSGNVIELCPVGALTSKTYRFKSRPWDLMTQKSICSKCSNGCNIKLDFRMDEVLRVNARLNEDVNEEWTCDKGKFGHDYISSPDRLKTPLMRKDGKFVEVSWHQAYSLLAEKLLAAGTNSGAIAGGRTTNESVFLLQKLFREILHSNNLDCRLESNALASSHPLFKKTLQSGMGNRIADIEKMKAVLVIGSDLQDEQPILFLRLRKAWRFEGTKVVFASDHTTTDSTSVSDFANVNLIYNKGSELAVLKALENALTSVLSGNPDAPKTATPSDNPASASTGLAQNDIQLAASLLARGELSIIAGKSVSQHAQFPEIYQSLTNLLASVKSDGNLNIPVQECNTLGTMDMGMLPGAGPGFAGCQSGMGTAEMLQASADGNLQALWIVGADPVQNYYNNELAIRGIENCPFLVVSELTLTETAKRADLILPAVSIAEQEGTFTSCEGRVQKLFKAFEPVGSSKPDWLIMAEISAILGAKDLYFTSKDVLHKISEEVPGYQNIQPGTIGDQGIFRTVPVTI